VTLLGLAVHRLTKIDPKKNIIVHGLNPKAKENFKDRENVI